VMMLFWPLFARSAWFQAATVVAGATGEGAGLSFSRLVGVDSDSLCCGGHDMSGRCSGLLSLGLPRLNQPLIWRARQARALLWPQLARSGWAQPATVVAGTTGEGADLASGHSVGVGSANHCGGGHDS
jgi:hypothetical protein